MQAPCSASSCRRVAADLLCGRPLTLPHLSWLARCSSSSTRWKQRQGNDFFAREAKVQGLKSRAAFKLLEMDSRYRIFKKGQVVVDLGFAPGSWSQVAVERTKPSGRVVGIDLIPAQPPKGVSTIQGNFLSPGVHALVKQYLVDADARQKSRQESAAGAVEGAGGGDPSGSGADEPIVDRPSYIDMERQATHEPEPEGADVSSDGTVPVGQNRRLVDRNAGIADVEEQVVLSDMSAPWPQTHGFSVNSISNPYNRMMNTSGISFKDHVGSMDLCTAALTFASDTLKSGGHFVCKFYQGPEDKTLENLLKKMFAKVHREKPESSRSVSRRESLSHAQDLC
ncbi:23S ribosomal RNA methyltransferase [Thozetella sp. PMI_491]|nr:23S ribosomal RNA methyltransferase [Thozetella sp. PMI_491]